MKKWSNGVKIGGLIIVGLLFWGTVQADVTFSIRHQDNLFFESSTITLPGGDKIFSAVDSVTGDPVDISVAADSVMGILGAVDDAEAGFSISTLTYFSSFSSLFVECITIGSSTACNNWQYVVNGVAPGVGMDATTLVDGDVVFVYFGDSHRTILSASSVKEGESFEVTAQDYQYEDNTWDSLTGVTIGVTQPDPDNPFSPIEIATQSVDAQGIATFQITPAGSYNVGIKEDFYFPTLSLTVTPTSFVTGGGLVTADIHESLDVGRAVDFLSLYQEEDGSVLNSPLLSDWTAVAFGAYEGMNFGKEELRSYLLSDPNPGSSVTDYERRAMALMALEVNPYSGTDTNYIAKILDSFDGEQFGSRDQSNDDIFALLVLLRSGYTDADPIIQRTIASVITAQWDDGSWGGVDMTAAAVQALSLTTSGNGVQFALSEAMPYLRQSQEKTGGFGNVYSTSWVLQALHVLEQDEIWWQKGDHTPGDYLHSAQAEDGGVNESDTLSNRVWATAYAVPATMEKAWGDILLSFSKPVPTEELLVFSEEIEESSVPRQTDQEVLLKIEQELIVISIKVAVLEQEVQLLLGLPETRFLAQTPEVVKDPEVVIIDKESEVLLAGITVLPESDLLTAAAVQSVEGGFLSQLASAQLLIWGIRIALLAFFLYLVFVLGKAFAARRSMRQA